MLKTVSTQLALASDTLSEILANGNTSGPNNIVMDAGYGINGTLGATTPATVAATTISATGAATFGGTATATQFSSISSNAALPSFGVAPGNGIYNAGTNILGFSTNSENRMTVNADGNLNLVSGNVVLASGSGIDFSATAGTGTSELFSDYEEGTWTPGIGAISGYSGALTSSGATYTKIGNVVTVRARVFFASAAGVITAGDQIAFTGLPFSAAAIGGLYDNTYAVCALSQSDVRRGTMDGVMTGATTFQVVTSNVNSATARNSTVIGISFSYRTV